jgi:glycogen(starch) synthase
MHKADPLPIAAAYAPWPDAALIEVSWEVCHQVGGIYQVLRSKAETMVRRWHDRYLLIGPLIPQLADVEFEAEDSGDWVGELAATLRREGLPAVAGRWLISGRPRALLLDHTVAGEWLGAMRARVRRQLGVDPSSHDPLLDDVLRFGDCVRRALLAFLALPVREGTGPHGAARPARVVAHFHEWVGGLALPLLHAEGARLATVFTTHATSVGRYAMSRDGTLYDNLPLLDGQVEAERLGIAAQHGIEAACAARATIFTTLSPLTAEECSRLLGREPEILTPNGLNIGRFDLGHDFQTHHAQCKEQIHQFVMGHFFPSYAFDLDRTLYAFTAGRFEPRNKGFDLCLETLARLNTELRAKNLGINVVFFVITARETRSLEPHTLRARGILDELQEVSQRIGRDVGERLFRSAAAGRLVPLDEMVDEYWRLRHRRVAQGLRTDRLPPISTHVIQDPVNDPILTHAQQLGLHNSASDPVKLVYHPEFISPVSPLWRMDYEQFVRGCHLGIFPSTYEPWGYTPLECVAMGVPAVTSDLAGFGRYVGAAFPDHDEWGVVVLRRRGRSFHDAAGDLTRRVLDFCRLDRRGRIALRNEVEAHSRAFDWSQIGSAYHQAHDLALTAHAQQQHAAARA